MSGGVAPLASITLRDGTQLQVATDGVHHGSQIISLAKIQDARRVSPNPEVIALRVAGTGLVEFEPEQSGEGSVLLEALFQLRPDLRPAGFGSQEASPSGYPEASYWGGTGIRSGPSSPYGSPAPFGYGEIGAMAERRARGLLTPVPRGFGETIAAIFQLYGSKFRLWLLLGLGVVPLAAILDGGFSFLLFSHILQLNSSSASFSTSSCFLPAIQLETGATLLRDGIASAALWLLSLLVTSLQTAIMAIAARDAALDHPLAVKPTYGSAWRRFVPTLGASFLAGSAYWLVLAPGFLSYGYAYATGSRVNFCQGSGANGSALVAVYLGSVLLVVGIVLAIVFAVRLGFAPYIAATSNVQARQAISRSWQLTRGHFWRAFFVILLTGTAAYLVLYIASAFPPLVTILIATPIASLLTVPFIALTYTLLLYDLRLRHDGYASLTQETTAVTSTPPASVPPLG